MFLEVSQSGSSTRTRSVISVCKRILDGDSLVGYTASRKVGNAVSRNFAKRRLRSLVREFSSEIVGGFVFVFIATRKTVEIGFSELRADFIYSLRKSKENEFRNAK